MASTSNVSLLDLPEALLERIAACLQQPLHGKRLRLVCRQLRSIVNRGVLQAAWDDNTFDLHAWDGNMRHVQAGGIPLFSNLQDLSLLITAANPSAQPERPHNVGVARRRRDAAYAPSEQLQQVQRMFAEALRTSGGAASWHQAALPNQATSEGQPSRTRHSSWRLQTAERGQMARHPSHGRSNGGQGEASLGTEGAQQTQHDSGSGTDDDGSSGNSSSSSSNDSNTETLAKPAPDGTCAHLSPLESFLQTGLPRLQHLQRLVWELSCRPLSTQEWDMLTCSLPNSCTHLALPLHLVPGTRPLHRLRCFLASRPVPTSLDLSVRGGPNRCSTVALVGGCVSTSHADHEHLLEGLFQLSPWLTSVRGLAIPNTLLPAPLPHHPSWVLEPQPLASSTSPDLAGLLPRLHATTSLELAWPGDAIDQVSQSCEQLVSYLEQLGLALAAPDSRGARFSARNGAGDGGPAGVAGTVRAAPDARTSSSTNALTPQQPSWGSYNEPDGRIAAASCQATSPTLPISCGLGLARLTRLSLYSYVGILDPLLAALSALPLLCHLDTYHYDLRRHVNDAHLALLAALPHLRHLGCNCLDLRQQDSCAPHLTSLEVGLSVYSMARLAHVFPGVQSLNLRWLWSQATRKLAGWHSVAVLHLAHPDYVEDWALLRTLRGLRHLGLAKGSGKTLLSHILCIAADLPGLQVLEIDQWEVVVRAHCAAAQQRQADWWRDGRLPLAEPGNATAASSSTAVSLQLPSSLRALCVSACCHDLVHDLLQAPSCMAASLPPLPLQQGLVAAQAAPPCLASVNGSGLGLGSAYTSPLTASGPQGVEDAAAYANRWRSQPAAGTKAYSMRQECALSAGKTIAELWLQHMPWLDERQLQDLLLPPPTCNAGGDEVMVGPAGMAGLAAVEADVPPFPEAAAAAGVTSAGGNSASTADLHEHSCGEGWGRAAYGGSRCAASVGSGGCNTRWTQQCTAVNARSLSRLVLVACPRVDTLRLGQQLACSCPKVVLETAACSGILRPLGSDL